MKSSGRFRPDIKEVARMWTALSEQERRDWDNKAREEERRQFQELKDRTESGGGTSAEGEEVSVAAGGGDSDEEDRSLLALQLPFGAPPRRARETHQSAPECRACLGSAVNSVPLPPAARVTKIIKLNGDLLKISRDACFLTARVTELFLERAVVEAAGEAARGGRKTVTLKDIITSMRNHPNPESLQAFVGAPAARRPRSCRPACTSASTSSTSSTGTSTSAAIYRRARPAPQTSCCCRPARRSRPRRPSPSPSARPPRRSAHRPRPARGARRRRRRRQRLRRRARRGRRGRAERRVVCF